MVCKYCGAQLTDSEKICGAYGKSVSDSGDETVLMTNSPNSGSGDETVLMTSSPNSGSSDETVLMTSSPNSGSSDETVPMAAADLVNPVQESPSISEKTSVNKTVSRKKKRIPAALIAAPAVIVAVCCVGVYFFLNNSKSVEDILSDADKNFNDKNYGEAMLDYDAVLMKDPINTKAYIGKANIYINQENYEKAKEILSDGFSRTNDDKIWELLRELTLKDMGELSNDDSQ